MANFKDVITELGSNEVDYESVALKLGEDAIPYLRQIVEDIDTPPLLASKAVYLASVLHGENYDQVLRAGARSIWPEVRVAVAAGLKNVPENLGKDLFPLALDDADSGVRKTALRSAAYSGAAYTKETIDRLARSDAKEFVRDAAARALESLR